MTHSAPQTLAEGRITFGPGPAQDLSPELAQAVLWELWAASPDRFGNLVKKGMIRLWGAGASSAANGSGPRHG